MENSDILTGIFFILLLPQRGSKYFHTSVRWRSRTRFLAARIDKPENPL